MISCFSVAMTSEVAQHLTGHLRRADGQEDCAFVLWRPSTGASRTTALLAEVVLPRKCERIVHGTVDFTSAYFLRAAALAAEHGCGLGFIHAHPKGRGWQRLNGIDYAAEESFAAQTQVITGRPLVGLTFAGTDAGFGARIWQQQAPRRYAPTEAESVRVAGGRLTATFNNRLLPSPSATNRQLRTVSAWGQTTQDDLARLHVGVVGCGSVGMLVVEALARTGIQRLSLFDFDTVEEVNLDRLHGATIRDVRLHRAKAHLAARTARRAATATHFRGTPYELSVVEPAGFAAAADCDVIFSCVDRPWPRAVLNLLAYAHLIPVVARGRARAPTPAADACAAPNGAPTSPPPAALAWNAWASTTPPTSKPNATAPSTTPPTSPACPPTIRCAARRTSSSSPRAPRPRSCISSSPWRPRREGSPTPAPICTTWPPAPSTVVRTAAKRAASMTVRCGRSATTHPSRSPDRT
ncbi:ThiF family adenylyltransferase [Streptomyces sp. CL12-4]|uniref:ThiF family adenylyltransferase n=1 Tax=Streptomyces sp. CL12-4 TaxID=2810306 RepID=UPI001EFBE731|nr:ThiF family adenylyltransferase [Streptomyces sp. CL12-4]MCG8970212.1 ThiF family adenylyltransferase [Streptomyces sp. CL12-4]